LLSLRAERPALHGKVDPYRTAVPQNVDHVAVHHVDALGGEPRLWDKGLEEREDLPLSIAILTIENFRLTKDLIESGEGTGARYGDTAGSGFAELENEPIMISVPHRFNRPITYELPSFHKFGMGVGSIESRTLVLRHLPVSVRRTHLPRLPTPRDTPGK